jgi:hypothetical protein
MSCFKGTGGPEPPVQVQGDQEVGGRCGRRSGLHVQAGLHQGGHLADIGGSFLFTPSSREPSSGHFRKLVWDVAVALGSMSKPGYIKEAIQRPFEEAFFYRAI